MDVFTALQTAVSGLKAQSFSLDNISGNIANSQTTGYKRIDTNFVDLIAEQSPSHQVAGTVAANSRLTTTVQGNVSATDIPTNMALNGSGFFVVKTKAGDVNGQTAFSNVTAYTRRGDFSLDKDGYLVNGGGAYLTGTSLDPITGQAKSNGPIDISSSILPARATSTITYSANLPKTPATTNASASIAGSELLGALPSGANPTILSGTGTGTVAAGSDALAFINSTIAGPALTAYSASGSPISIQTRWGKVQNADTATGKSDTWNLFYANTSTVASQDSSWTNAGTAFAFNASGQLSSPSTTSVTIPNLTVDGTNLGGIVLSYGGGGLTGYNASGGQTTTNTLQQDGYASGTLNNISITADGKISGTYSNGNTISLANISVAQFTNSDGLKADSAGNYEQTLESGNPLIGLKATTIVGGNVEQSNTDIASEFAKMIVTQQAYSANTKVISTSQDMMTSLINIIR